MENNKEVKSHSALSCGNLQASEKISDMENDIPGTAVRLIRKM